MQTTEQKQTSKDRKSLVVSIHDVSPSTWIRSRAMLDDLRDVGVKITSLLIIPDHHHRGLISKDADFSNWLGEKCAEGHEAVVHGFCHLREENASDGFWKRLVTRSYTDGEGEFYDISREKADKYLTAARGEFDACGLKYCGFIAPAWLLGSEAENAVRHAGFDYTTRIATVSDFRAGKVHSARSLVWSVRAAWRRVCSLAWNAALFHHTSDDSLLRVGLHPPDWDYPAIRRQILQILGTALAARDAMTYENWLARTRITS